MRILLLLFVLLGFQSAVAEQNSAGNQADYPVLLESLKNRDFKVKADAIEQISAIKSDTSRTVLSSLLEGSLYYIKNGGQVVTTTRAGRNLHATDILSGSDLGSFKKRKLKKISLNNTLRTQVRVELATFDLSHPEVAYRLDAVNSMMKRMDADSVVILKQMLKREESENVRDAMYTALALQSLDSADQQARAMAVVLLEESLNPVVKNKLVKVYNEVADGKFKVRLGLAIKRIESRLSIYRFLEKLFFGLSLGSVLVLAAIGLAITFGVMGVINMAHGELIMIGAYTAYVMQQILPGHTGWALVLSIPAGFLVAALVGIAIERGVIRHLYGRPLETLLATFGISLLLQQSVRSIFSPLNRSVATPEWMSGSIQINDALSLTMNRITILIFSIVVFALLFLVLKKTSLGLQVRAVSQNREMARSMGIRSARVDALTFGLGSGIAGIAGVALSQLTNVGPNLGQAYIIDSFMVVVFGGVGNLWGTLISGMSLGVLNKFLEPWAGAVLAKIMVLILLILFIQKRPRGLFPQRGRVVES